MNDIAGEAERHRTGERQSRIMNVRELVGDFLALIATSLLRCRALGTYAALI
jgi:hypothetical protein